MGSSSPSRVLFDEVRGLWVAATPEEYVRQKILKKMVHALCFPKELIVVEKELKELYCAHSNSVNFDSARRSKIEAERGRPFPVGKADEEDRFGKVHACQNSHNLSGRSITHLSAPVLPQRRVDILCYGKNIHPQHPLYPLLLIECKKDAIDEKAIEQLVGYNTHVQAYFIALVGPEQERFGYRDKKTKQYIFHSGFPTFNDLISWLSPTPA